MNEDSAMNHDGQKGDSKTITTKEYRDDPERAMSLAEEYGSVTIVDEEGTPRMQIGVLPGGLPTLDC